MNIITVMRCNNTSIMKTWNYEVCCCSIRHSFQFGLVWFRNGARIKLQQTKTEIELLPNCWLINSGWLSASGLLGFIHFASLFFQQISFNPPSEFKLTSVWMPSDFWLQFSIPFNFRFINFKLIQDIESSLN